MDWTLSHMFSPAAHCLSKKVDKEHEALIAGINFIIVKGIAN